MNPPVWWDERCITSSNGLLAEGCSTSQPSELGNPEECRRRYVADKSARRQHHVLQKVFTPKECVSVLRQVEHHARSAAAAAALTPAAAPAAGATGSPLSAQPHDGPSPGWHVNRHSAYATTDLPAFEVPRVDAFVRRAVRERVFPVAAAHMGFDPDDFYFKDLFFVKYETVPGAQSSLELHRDGSLFSFNILLNDAAEFEGGGTYFKPSDVTVMIQQGDCLLHDGIVEHAGAAITRGRRMLLVGFVENIRSNVPAAQRRKESDKAAEWLHWEVQAEAARAVKNASGQGQVNVLEDAMMLLVPPQSPNDSDDEKEEVTGS